MTYLYETIAPVVCFWPVRLGIYWWYYVYVTYWPGTLGHLTALFRPRLLRRRGEVTAKKFLDVGAAWRIQRVKITLFSSFTHSRTNQEQVFTAVPCTVYHTFMNVLNYTILLYSIFTEFTEYFDRLRSKIAEKLQVLRFSYQLNICHISKLVSVVHS